MKQLTEQPFVGSRRYAGRDNISYVVTSTPDGFLYVPVRAPGRHTGTPLPSFLIPYARIEDLMTPDTVYYARPHEKDVTAAFTPPGTVRLGGELRHDLRAPAQAAVTAVESAASNPEIDAIDLGDDPPDDAAPDIDDIAL